MAHTIRDKTKLLTRVRRIKGQTQALEQALVGEADCADVLQQIAAVRGAVNGLMVYVLEEHIREHLARERASKIERTHDVEQVVNILRSYLK
ncbi:MAG: metal/formaldehyde-sensitive transcriptional repressor [Burkholderiales bacterium]|nr:metal/formaldehyde-sensitive transcriptional repressor [Burkholderiales bacterium]